ncbi:MAG TPA: four-helix bundle copper-binding protein [Chitinophagaceae bacterium]|nr:four-helix bundle copper-binding protein [Chitinophagaceae bacterium]
MHLQSTHANAACQLCADICIACAEECEKHEHEHCLRCAAICRQCAEVCMSMAAA